MKKNKVIYAVLVLFSLFLMIMYDGWQTEVLFWLVIFLPVVLGIFAFYCSRNITVYFDEIAEYCQKDNHIKKYVMLKNDTRFALPRVEISVCIEDYMGQKARRTLVLNSEAYTIRNFAMEMAFEHYGMMTIRLEKVKVYDYLGICSFKKKPNLETVIYVFPDYSEKVHFSETNPFRQDENEREMQAGKRGTDRSEVVENDEYREGDDIRNIHWKLSSKGETLIVKHFGEPKEESINIYVDLQVDKERRYDCCDGILSALYAVVNACEKSGYAYKIWGCNGYELFGADHRSIMTGITERTSNSSGYQCVSQIRSQGGTGICITAADVDARRIEGNATVVDYFWQKDKQQDCEISGDMVFRVAVEQKENKEKDSFIKEYNDRIRTHQKLNYHQQSDGYLPLQTGIALLAAVISILCIYDVIYIRRTGSLLAFAGVLFVLFHFFVYYVTMENDDGIKRVRMRTILILCGYIAVILVAGPGNLVEGVYSVIDLFQETLVATGSNYGFLEFEDPYINWLLLLVAYAVVDVIFNFCVDFVLGIHLLVVVPLLSIALIVGSMPAAAVTYLAGIYLPLILVVNRCVRHGKGRNKKYLSDDYIYTGNIAVSTGVLTLIVSAAILLVSSICVHAGGYETPEWIQDGKQSIQELMDIENWDNLINGRGAGNEEFVEDSNGWLDDTKKVEYTGEIMLEITASENIGDSFYIKEYAGSKYNDKAWLERSETILQAEEQHMQIAFEAEGYSDNWYELTSLDPYGVADFREFLPFRQAMAQNEGVLQAWSGDVEECYMKINTMTDVTDSIPQPYLSTPNNEPVWGDGYLAGMVTGKNDEFYYSGYVVDGYPDIAGITQKYGEYPYIKESASGAKAAKTRTDLESYYYEWIEEDYLEIPETLKDEMEQFKSVSVVYGDEKYQLILGDKQYLEIGYEPYIQYVRNFFQEQGYVYNLNITRKNNYNDFISDFMKRKTGYCIHFASTAVMIFRSMGIPARYAEGYYVTKEYRTETVENGYVYQVPDSAAHAWVEIYFEGVGWLPVEVTPGNDNFTLVTERFTATQQPTANVTQTTQPATQKTTGAAEETTTRERQTVQTTRKAEQKKTANTNYVVIVVPVLIVFALLIVYQVRTERLRGRLKSQNRQERMNAMDAYFVAVTRCWYKDWREYYTNEQKAEYLSEEKLAGISDEDIGNILRILDKIRYAPAGSVTDEEMDKLYEFLAIYARTGYQKGKLHEKFAYKYIKCLYLKDK